MIRSRHFWLGAVLIALIPLLSVDIVMHYLSWQKEVREQLIFTVQDIYHFDNQQKAKILDKAFERNSDLTLLIVFKSALSLIFLIVGILQLRGYVKKEKPKFLKPALTFICLAVLFLSVKFTWIVQGNNIKGVNVLSVDKGTTFQSLMSKNFKGKVIYVDFWGTTCGPCLAEFENFTQPLKQKYQSNSTIQYLYIAQGSRYLWKQQIEKYNIKGYHLFVDKKTYSELYHSAINDTAMVYMPRYLIIDRQGKVAINNAERPSSSNLLFAQLDKYLNAN